MMLFSLALYFVVKFGYGIGRAEGIILILALAVYLFILIRKAQKNRKIKIAKDSIDIDVNTTSNFKIVSWVLIGGTALWGGSEFLIEGAVNLALYFEVSNRIIAVTMIAIGTSVPELAASVMAALKHEKELLIGNIIGSNIFNIASVLGITAIIHPITVSASSLPLVLFDIIWMICFSAAIYIFAHLPKRFILSRYKGIILFVGYTIFMGLIFLSFD